MLKQYENVVKTLLDIKAKIKKFTTEIAEMDTEISSSRKEINRLKYEGLQLEFDAKGLEEQILSHDEIETLRM